MRVGNKDKVGSGPFSECGSIEEGRLKKDPQKTQC